jgi:carboxylate-amine ligase
LGSDTDTAYQFGIEEELFLADSSTRGTPRKTVKAFHQAVQAEMPKVERELVQCQVEIASPPSTSSAEAGAHLAQLRKKLTEIGQAHQILVLAAGTHPVARWARQRVTSKDRYKSIMQMTQMAGKRSLVCGLHVHVQVPRPEERIDLMNRLLPYMPLLLALSASSPFWGGRPTGLAAYRLSAWGEMPRSGLPDLFQNEADYQRYVDTMVRSKAIADASFLWWTLRPSIHFPTLELRVADSCTRLDDTLAIAALYRCLVRLAVRKPELNRGLSGASRAIVSENLWRAQRDGIHSSLIDEQRAEAIPFDVHLDAVLASIAEDAEALGCQPEIEIARQIAITGTSADRQLEVFAQSRERSPSMDDASAAVVDWLAATTAGGAKT